MFLLLSINLSQLLLFIRIAPHQYLTLYPVSILQYVWCLWCVWFTPYTSLPPLSSFCLSNNFFSPSLFPVFSFSSRSRSLLLSVSYFFFLSVCVWCLVSSFSLLFSLSLCYSNEATVSNLAYIYTNHHLLGLPTLC